MNNQAMLNKVLENGRAKINLPNAQLVEYAIKKNQGVLTDKGALKVLTGKYTGRSPLDKFFVDEPTSSDLIDWGPINRPMAQDHFQVLLQDVLAYLEEREDYYVFNGFAGADPNHRLNIRVVNELAWQNLFIHQLLLRPQDGQLQGFSPDFTLLCVPGFQADPAKHGTNSDTFIAINFGEKLVLIGGTQYAGEIKKSVFTIANYVMPKQNVLPMHCSANVGSKGDVALFFGLSGTGKTTLSADPVRRLIGDDEHGWSDKGIFNIEGGCYAKCIGLSYEDEPQIWDAIKFGSVLENVVLNEDCSPDFANAHYTENTRAAYPADFIGNVEPSGSGGQPNVIIFLTADAFGVLPPISKISWDQAMYHFLSGYTSKLAGTERGITQPVATFSACFGAPFLPMSPKIYTEMLGQRIKRHNTNVFLINTGWSGGPYGVGKRIKLAYTRAMVSAAISGDLNEVSYTVEPVFNLAIPNFCPNVPHEILQPRHTWPTVNAYDEQAQKLAALFKENYDKISAF